MRHIYIQKNAAAAVLPTVVLNSITQVTRNGCTYLADVTSDGGSTITARGVGFYTTADCSGGYIDSVSAAGAGQYSSFMTTLNPSTTYYARAWAENAVGRAVSNIISFTTLSVIVIPSLNGGSIGNITSNSATVNAQITSKGGGTISASGMCWSTSQNPTTANSKTTDGLNDIGMWTSALSGLSPNTTYYVRAYATNEAGTGYDGWNMSFTTTGRQLILQFDTNCPSTKAFQPSIASLSGTYEWDLGDGTTVNGNAVNHTYASSATKTVKLYGTGTCLISEILIYSGSVVGGMNLSHSAFATLQKVNIYSNSAMTGITLPATITGAIDQFNVVFNGFTGTLNLSALQNFSDAASISLNNNLISGVIFGNTLTGKVSYLDIRGISLTGTLDLSPLTKWADGSSLMLLSNPSLTQVTFGTVTSGSLNSFDIRSSGLDFVNIAAWALATRQTPLVYVFNDNAMTAAQVNRTLSDLDSISIATTSGQIFIAGTNAAPDMTSGGYNGTAAKASLTAKGFYVGTN